MRKRILRALVGGDKPRKPKRSLPSYDEPTPETHRRLSREEEAELALKRTVVHDRHAGAAHLALPSNDQCRAGNSAFRRAANASSEWLASDV